jgi:hypothetical protein
VSPASVCGPSSSGRPILVPTLIGTHASSKLLRLLEMRWTLRVMPVIIRIGAHPAAILFIDDNARNIAAARDVGLAAGQWTLADGHDALLALLAKHGVAVS